MTEPIKPCPNCGDIGILVNGEDCEKCKRPQPSDPEEWEDVDDDGMEDDEPDYWYCIGCGTSSSTDPGGWGCPNCGAIMEPEYF